MRFLLSITALLGSAGLFSATPRDWDGELSSSALFRAGTGVTHPIFYDLPEWSRNNAVNSDWLLLNPAFLSHVNDDRKVFVPIEAQGRVVGSYYSLVDTFQVPSEAGSDLLDALSEKDLQRVKARFQTYYVMQNFAYSLHYTQQRNLWLENSSNDFYYQVFKDFRLQFSSGGRIFDTQRWGRLDFGSAIKGIFRSGAEKFNTVSGITASTNYAESQFLEQGFAVGLDYSLLWTSPDFAEENWGYQIAIVGKDVGTTRFIKAEALYELLGTSVPFTREFPRIANNTILGFGLKLPKFRDGIRSAIRLEYGYWTRDIATSNKVAVSYELRFPSLVTLYSGLRGRQWAAGLGLRFRGMEFELGSHVDLWGNGDELKTRRAWIMELKGAF